MIGFQLWVLWSLNERLAGREGRDLPEPTAAYLSDLMAAYQVDAEAQERASRP